MGQWVGRQVDGLVAGSESDHHTTLFLSTADGGLMYVTGKNTHPALILLSSSLPKLEDTLLVVPG